MPRRQNRAQSARDFWLSDARAAMIASGVVSDGLICAHAATARSLPGMIEQFFWKLHRPGNIGDASVKLAINEIGASAKEQSERRGYDRDCRPGSATKFCADARSKA